VPYRTLCAIVFTCLTVSGSFAFAQNNLWRSYTELEGRVGGAAALGQYSLFVPLWQDSGSILFVDARGYQDDQSAAEGNWGLAYRTVLENDWILGVNGFFDLRRTQYDNWFSQAGFGVELLDVNRGFRINGYIPDGEAKSIAGANGAFLQNGNIVVGSGLEASFWGIDAEAERLMWFRDGNSSSVDLELWAAVGVFHFDNDGDGFEAMTGPRLRTELRVFDVPLLGRDSRLVLGGQYQHDDVRGSLGTGTVSVRIPFGPGGGRKNRRLRGLARRMVAPIERDIDIVTNTFSTAEAANFASSGQAISQAVVIDANTVGAAGVVAGAGANSVVIVDGSAGTILPGGSILTNNGQVLLGGGSGLAVIGANTGTAATFNGPGIRPTINNTNNAINTIGVTTDASVIGLDVIGGLTGIISGNLTVGSQILNNNVSNTASNGFRFNGVNGTVAGNTATNNALDGFNFSTVTGTFAGNTATINGSNGFFFSGVSGGGTVTGNTAINNGTHGVTPPPIMMSMASPSLAT